MNKLSKNKLRLQRRRKIRAKISGNAKIPRLCVFRSLKGISAQVINDDKGLTLVSAKIGGKIKNDIQGAKKVGEEIAKKCLENKIKEIVFDRSGYKYHGKVKALAEGAREGGIKF